MDQAALLKGTWSAGEEEREEEMETNLPPIEKQKRVEELRHKIHSQQLYVGNFPWEWHVQHFFGNPASMGAK
jgi:hypothetical protein